MPIVVWITINRFLNRVKKEINEVFNQTVLLFSSKGFISLNVEYIDETKIESKANRYTFVWRKTVERNRERLMKKIQVLLELIDDVIALNIKKMCAKLTKEGMNWLIRLFYELINAVFRYWEHINQRDPQIFAA